MKDIEQIISVYMGKDVKMQALNESQVAKVLGMSLEECTSVQFSMLETSDNYILAA